MDGSREYLAWKRSGSEEKGQFEPISWTLRSLWLIGWASWNSEGNPPTVDWPVPSRSIAPGCLVEASALPGGTGANLYTWTPSTSVYLSVKWGQEQPPYENLGKSKGIHAGELLRTPGVQLCSLDVSSSNDCYCVVKQVSQSNEVRRQGVQWVDGMYALSNTTSLHFWNSWSHSAHQWAYASKCAAGWINVAQRKEMQSLAFRNFQFYVSTFRNTLANWFSLFCIFLCVRQNKKEHIKLFPSSCFCFFPPRPPLNLISWWVGSSLILCVWVSHCPCSFAPRTL